MKTYKYKVEVDQNSMNQQMMQVATSRMNGLMAQSMVGTVAPLSASGMLSTYTPGLASLAGLAPTGGPNYGPDAQFNAGQYGVMTGANTLKGIADFAVPWYAGEAIGAGIGGAIGTALAPGIGTAWGAGIGGFVGGFAGDTYLGGVVGDATRNMVDFATGGVLSKSRMGAMAKIGSMGGVSVAQGYGMAEAAFKGVGHGARNTLSAGFDDSDLADIGALGFQSGQLSGTQDVDKFVTNYRDLIKSTRDIMKTLGKSHKDAISAMRDMQNMGIFNTDEASQAIINEGTRSAYTSFSSGQLRGLRGQGFNMGFNTELGGVQGGNMMVDFSTFASSAMGRRPISKITGQAGTTGDAAMGQILAGGALSFSNSDLGKSLFTSMLNPDGTFDEGYAQKLISGDYDIYNTSQRAGRMLQGVNEINPYQLSLGRRVALQNLEADDMVRIQINAARQHAEKEGFGNNAEGLVMSMQAGGMSETQAVSNVLAYNNLVGFSKGKHADKTLPFQKRRRSQEEYRNSLTGMISEGAGGVFVRNAYQGAKGYTTGAMEWMMGGGGLGSGPLSSNWIFNDRRSEEFGTRKAPMQYDDVYVANLEERERLMDGLPLSIGASHAKGWATDNLFDELGLDEVAAENRGAVSTAMMLAKQAFYLNTIDDEVEAKYTEKSRKSFADLVSNKYGLIEDMIKNRKDVLGSSETKALYKSRFTKGLTGEGLTQAQKLYGRVLNGIADESKIGSLSESMRKIVVEHAQQGLQTEAFNLMDAIESEGGAGALGITKTSMEMLSGLTDGNISGKDLKDFLDVGSLDPKMKKVGESLMAQVRKTIDGYEHSNLAKIESSENFKKYYELSSHALVTGIVQRLDKLISLQQ